MSYTVITSDWNFICLSFYIYQKWSSIDKTLRTGFFFFSQNNQRELFMQRLIMMMMTMTIMWQVISASLTFSFQLFRSKWNSIVLHRLGNTPSINTVLLYAQLGWVFHTKCTPSPAPTLSLFTTWHCPLPLTEEKEGHIMVVEVASVPLCWPTASALQKPRSPESWAAPLPIAVPDTSLPSSPHWGHPIRRRKWSSIFLSFAGRTRKNKMSLGHAPGSGQLYPASISR